MLVFQFMNTLIRPYYGVQKLAHENHNNMLLFWPDCERVHDCIMRRKNKDICSYYGLNSGAVARHSGCHFSLAYVAIVC